MTESFRLTARQAEANKLLGGPQRHTLLAGGARSGKTFLLTRAVLIRALKASGSRHAILRFRFNAVRAAIWLDTLPKVVSLCFPGLRLTEARQDGFVELPNGSQIWFGGLDDKERVEKVLGQEYATIYFNEASQIPYSSYLVAKTRLAQVAGDLKQREYVDLNPAGTGHWTYRQFVQKLDPDPDSRKPLVNPEDFAAFFINPGDNSENLSPEFIKSLEQMPERHRKRFYEGQFVADIDGALWPLETLDKRRCDPADVPQMQRIVVAVDPSGTSGRDDDHSDDVGIVVAGKGEDGRAYVLEDLTVSLSPAGWGRVAVQAYHRHKADCIIAERNYGGAMVEHVIRTTDRNAKYKEVTASRGKWVRAEPVAQLFEDGIDKARIVGRMPLLEEQLSKFSTAGYMASKSPDRADAMVWAITELMLNEVPGFQWYVNGKVIADAGQ
jgi:PBSX family phage terminase large subunit